LTERAGRENENEERSNDYYCHASSLRSSLVRSACCFRFKLTLFNNNRYEDQTYSNEEEEMLSRIKKEHDTQRKTMEDVKSKDNRVSIRCSRGKRKIYKVTTVVDTPVAECIAYEFLKLSRSRGQQYSDAGDIDQEFIKKNNHCDLFRVVKGIKTSLKVHVREIYCNCVWKKLDDNYMVVAYDSIKATDLFRSSHLSKGHYSAYFECRKLQPFGEYEQTEVTYTFKYSVSGFLPIKAFEENLYLSYLLPITKMRDVFQKVSERSERQNKAAQARLRSKSTSQAPFVVELTVSLNFTRFSRRNLSWHLALRARCRTCLYRGRRGGSSGARCRRHCTRTLGTHQWKIRRWR